MTFKRCVAITLGLVLGLAVSVEARAEPAHHGIAMHGAPKYGPAFTHFDYANPNAPKGGEVRQAAIGTAFDNFNGFILKGNAATGLGMTSETLLTSADDEAFSAYGLIAQSIEVPEDRSWVIFNLRPEARWHDGKPITADDVVFSFETLKTKGHPFYQFYYASVKSAEKLSERRVKFSFGEGDNRELPLIMGQLPILPKHYWQGREFDKTTLEPPLGSGPYKIGKFEPGRYIVYERVKDYWGKDLPVNKGRYNFDQIRFDYYRDATVALEAFKAGEYDWRFENVSKFWASGYDQDQIDKGLVIKEEVANERPTGMQGFVFNQRRDLFKDPLVRQALAYAFDFEWANTNLFYGQYSRTKSYFSNSELASSGLPSKEELEILTPFKDKLPPEVFTKTYEPPSTDGSGKIRKNLGEAVKLLKQAGWSVQDGKLKNKQGQVFEFEILLNSPVWERIALPFAKNLERLGISASVRVVDAAQYQERTDTFDFDMIVEAIGQSLSPGNEQRDFWSSESADRKGGRNYAGIKDPVVDQLVELVISAPDRDSLITRTRALDRVLLWGHHVIPNWHIQVFRLAYWNKFSKPQVTPKYDIGFDFWWVDPAKVKALEAKGVGAKN